MDGKFTLEIDMGNDAMRTRRDLARTLKDLAEKLKTRGIKPTWAAPGKYTDSGGILDDNGNSVGQWLYTEEK